MKPKSIQESILEQILANDEPSQPSPHPTNNYKRLQRTVNQSLIQSNHYLPQSYGKPLSASITDLEDELLRIKARASKMPGQYKGNFFHEGNIENSKRNYHNPNRSIKMKTENQHQQCVPPINYSTIYTRRSSMDQSLYDKALRQESVRKSWVAKKQKQIVEQQLRQCSYKPVINKTSRQIMNRVDKQQLYEKIKKKKEESMRKIIQQSEKRELKQCSFTPKVQKSQRKVTKSVKIQQFSVDDEASENCVNPKQRGERNSVSIFDHLYEDSKSRQLKTKKLQQNYMRDCHRPTIDIISKQITKNTNFQARMQVYQKRKLQKQIQKRQKQNKSLHESYRPTINTSSHNRQKQTSIHQYLYLQSKRSQPQPHPITPTPKIQANKKSTQVYEQRKILVFYQLFKLLDDDQDGIISINSICLDALPHQVIRIIYPLIEELEVMEVELQEYQFVHSISNLFKTLSVHQRDILLGFVGDKAKQDCNAGGKPKINYKSKMIASCNQRSQMSIYEYCSIKQAERQKHLQTERIQKSKRELQQCTFQPKIIVRCRN